MQKKSHKRKFKVGQMVRVLGSVSVTRNPMFNWVDLKAMIGGEFKIKSYKFQTGTLRKLAQNYEVNGYWFSAKELEAVETPEEFFTEKETDGPIAQVLLKVLERLQIDEEYVYQSNPKEYSSYFTCDLIEHFTKGEDSQEFDKTMKFLDTLGFESFHSGFRKFSEFEEGFHRQSARFNWIMFALTIAREEGV